APKGSAQAIRKVGELNWKPKFFLANTATSVASVLKPAGLQYAKDIISTSYLKDPTDPTWDADPAVVKWRAFMDKYYPDGDKTNANNLYGYVQSEAMLQVLQAVRRQSHPRECHEAGRQFEEFPLRPDAARHHGQHRAGRLFSDRADAVDEIQRRGVGTVRRSHHRRGGALESGSEPDSRIFLLEERHHSVVPLLDPHYPGIS